MPGPKMVTVQSPSAESRDSETNREAVIGKTEPII